ncbi:MULTISPECIES: type II toxin-antitoxin system RelE/ParE family toxin [unclassified Methylobacterium]|uniref:type II toxin-antitoxin system RelE/ParE family toxin n=1 Tax=unclassified Methylobacterium TaxID=2615210 RepID=UPI0013545647|nr:type II toxin-antitoxin system RelE/ParE family toxin [Methylobacterium sp. 2A]
MSLEVRLRSEAVADLESLYDYVAADSPERAIIFLRRIGDRCESLSLLPGAGRARDDLAPGLRLVAFERRVVIAYTLRKTHIDVLRVLYRGRDVNALLSQG